MKSIVLLMSRDMLQHLAAVGPHQKLALPVTALDKDGSVTQLSMIVEGANDGDGVRVLDMYPVDGAPDLEPRPEGSPVHEPMPETQPELPAAEVTTDAPPAPDAPAADVPPAEETKTDAPPADTQQPPAQGDTSLDDAFDLSEEGDGESDAVGEKPAE